MLSSVYGLECWAGTSSLIIPASSVAQVIEYEVSSPLPLSRTPMLGLGVHESRVLVSVALTSVFGRRTVKGVVLTEVLGCEWVVEVSAVGGFVAAELDPQEERLTPIWLRRATIGDERHAAWVDVAGMLDALGGSRPIATARGS